MPDVVSLLTSLKSTSWDINPIQTVPPWVTSLKNLHQLNLSRTKIKEIPSFIGQLTNLKTLGIDGLQLDPQLHSFWSSVSFSEGSAKLCDCGLEDLPPWLYQMQFIRQLDLSGNEMTHLPDAISILTNLHSLRLGRVLGKKGYSNKFTSIPDIVGSLGLDQLYLDQLHLTQRSLGMASIPNLKVFSIKMCRLAWLPDCY
eukprot:TRINITY_DN2114_c0_g1_i8.p1 TRINITY_DN2114_c0_g1~~TRINITY_DN2114_c0_g1_i8.p1  ORF type:complete len:199 (-),score=31.43 TRINITY_DN2114_c0_g1_i8:978-1574(-)